MYPFTLSSCCLCISTKVSHEGGVVSRQQVASPTHQEVPILTSFSVGQVTLLLLLGYRVHTDGHGVPIILQELGCFSLALGITITQPSVSVAEK